MIPQDALEQRLVEAYRQQTCHYDLALDLLAQAEDCANADGDTWVQKLHDILREVYVADTELADDKAAWQRAGRIPGSDLRAILDRLAARVKTLGERVDAQMARIVARRDQILPRIDVFFRQQQMLQAYGTHAQSAAGS